MGCWSEPTKKRSTMGGCRLARSHWSRKKSRGNRPNSAFQSGSCQPCFWKSRKNRSSDGSQTGRSTKTQKIPVAKCFSSFGSSDCLRFLFCGHNPTPTGCRRAIPDQKRYCQIVETEPYPNKDQHSNRNPQPNRHQHAWTEPYTNRDANCDPNRRSYTDCCGWAHCLRARSLGKSRSLGGAWAAERKMDWH